MNPRRCSHLQRQPLKDRLPQAQRCHRIQLSVQNTLNDEDERTQALCTSVCYRDQNPNQTEPNETMQRMEHQLEQIGLARWSVETLDGVGKRRWRWRQYSEDDDSISLVVVLYQLRLSMPERRHRLGSVEAFVAERLELDSALRCYGWISSSAMFDLSQVHCCAVGGPPDR